MKLYALKKIKLYNKITISNLVTINMLTNTFSMQTLPEQ